MAAPHLRHSRDMIQRAVFGLAVSSCLLACLGKTTSLGSPRGDQSSASSTDSDGAGDAAMSVSSADASAVFWTPTDSSAPTQDCGWYSWGPVPTTVACEYLLPSDNPDNDPNDDPRTWDPHHVRVEFASKNIGLFAGTAAGCGSTDGWYYVDPGTGQPPTRFMLCPESCARVQGDGGDGFLAMAAQSCH